MRNDILVTVGIPIYNAEKYLDECLESVTAQTYKNIEIILVNDGSTDNSLSVCKRWRENDDRIKIINKKNGGVGMARNSVIDIANGDYICFVDADDIISSLYIEILLKLCLEHNSEISYCGMMNCDNDIKSSKVYIENNRYDMNKLSCEEIDVNDNITALDNMFGLWILPNICGKCIKTELFKSIRFPLGQREDLAVNYKLIYEAKHIAGVKKLKLYFYRQHTESIMHKTSSESLVDFEYRKEMYDFLKKKACEKAAVKLQKQTMFILFGMISVQKESIPDWNIYKKKLNKVTKTLASEMLYEGKKNIKFERTLLIMNPFAWRWYKIVQRKIQIKMGKETLY